jgi:iron complex outermembrane receptor protein
MNWRYTLFGCSAMLGLTHTLPAFAQQRAGGPVEEIIVTAQRRVEAAEDVPISMTIASADQLEKMGVTKLENIALVAPAVQLSRTGVYTQPAIRGITTTLAGNYENNVAIYVDGTYLPFTRGLNTDLVNISQVQVLKGPQGTLFGRNATGGAILIQTLDPDMDESSGRVKVGFKKFNERQVQGYFSVPLNDTVAWNLATNYRESDGHIKDVDGFHTAPVKTYNITTKLRWEPVEALAITAKYEANRLSDGRTLATTYEGRSAVQRAIPGTFLARDDNETSVNFPVENTIHQHNTSLKAEYDFGWARLSSVTGYQRETDKLHYDLDGTKVRFFEQRTRDRNEALGQDINLTSSGDGPWQYTVGAYYFDSKLKTVENASLSASAPNPADRTRYIDSQYSTSETTAYAGYADVTWQFQPQWYLTAGLRYSREKKELLVECPTVTGPSCPAPIAFDGDETFKSWTPRVVLRYELDDSSNVYASYSKGFKSGLINIAAPFFNKIDPEKIDAFEVGYKTARAGWRLDTAAYYYDYKDLQVSSLVFINNVNTAITTNAASAEIYGAEISGAFSITEALNVSGGLAYTHARYKKFPNASQNGLVQGMNVSTPAACAIANPPCTADWEGKRLIRAPDWTGNIAIDYTVRTANTGEFVFATSVAYTSSYSPLKGDLDIDGSYRYDTGAHSMINARLSWTPPANDALTFTVLGENLGNSRYYFYRSGNAFGDYHVLGQPRTWGISADYRF